MKILQVFINREDKATISAEYVEHVIENGVVKFVYKDELEQTYTEYRPITTIAYWTIFDDVDNDAKSD